MKKIVTLTMLLMMFLLMGCGNESPTKAEKLVIGIEDEFPPISFRDEQNELVGFDIDLAKEIANRMNVDIEFKTIIWNQKREEIISGNIDLILNGLDIIDERKEYMIFTRPYMDDRQIFFVRHGNEQEIYTEGDLADKIVGTQTGSTAETYLNQDENLKKLFKDFKTYTKFKEGIEALRNEEINVFMCDELVARYAMNKNLNEFEIVNATTGFITEMAIGFPKEKVELRDRVQKVFDEMIKDGTAKKISEKWFGGDLFK